MQISLLNVSKATVLATVMAGVLSATANAQEPDCYDAEISARIISQTPTPIPDCDDCIIMRWPWILDLDVRRVHSGQVSRGPLMVLTVQHTDFRHDLGIVRWKLRHNTQGGFNVVGFREGPSRRCSPEEPPAAAYITPRDGQNLDDLRRESRAHYGRDN